MLPNQHVTIRGEFKFDVYDASGSVKYSERTPNFITSTGLCFPAYYAFADCFRFISLGSGTGANSIQLSLNNGWGTTGLTSGLSQYSYVGSRSDYVDPTTTNYETEACGYREETGRLVLTRSWRLPTGGVSFPTAFTFNEFMVSPGKPPVTGVFGTEACSCQDTVLDDDNNTLYGQDCAEIANFYTSPTICKGDKAFARVVKSVPVAKDDFLVVTYELNLIYSTGLKTFGIAITNTKGGSNWTGTLTGYAGLVHPAVKLINNGNILDSIGPLSASREQISTSYNFTNEYGESFVPPWGSPLEPSCTSDHLVAYLSTDNLQFLVNITGGAFQSHYSSGLFAWRSTPTFDVKDSFSDRYFNIRMNPENSFYPVPTDFKTEDTATSFGFAVSHFHHSAVQHTSLNTFTQTGRSRSSNYSCQFWGFRATNSGFTNKPVRAIVLAYQDTDEGSFVPFYDIILNSQSGNILPAIDRTNFTYAVPDTNYFYMEDGGDLTLRFDMSWSSPCEAGVSGCP